MRRLADVVMMEYMVGARRSDDVEMVRIDVIDRNMELLMCFEV